MKRRWELLLFIPACLLLLTPSCRTQLPAEFSRGQIDLNMPAGGASPEPNMEYDDATLMGDAGPNEGVAPIEVEPGIYDLDTLYAIPQQTSATTGEAVRIVVATGIPAGQFKFMNGVRVTFSGVEPAFVPGSYNVGAIGGTATEADGIWSAANPQGFLLPNDFMLSWVTYVAELDAWAIDFNVTPINSEQISSSEGALFNFAATFAKAGTVVLGFEQFHDVKRTYFSDLNSAEYYWGDISNSHTGVANSITVTE